MFGFYIIIIVVPGSHLVKYIYIFFFFFFSQGKVSRPRVEGRQKTGGAVRPLQERKQSLFPMRTVGSCVSPVG